MAYSGSRRWKLREHSPTLQADEAVMEAFYSDLLNVIQLTDFKNKLINLGDFNVRVDRDFHW